MEAGEEGEEEGVGAVEEARAWRRRLWSGAEGGAG